MKHILSCVAILILVTTVCRAQVPDDPKKPDKPLKNDGSKSKRIKLGGLEIDPVKKFIEIKGKISLNRGLIELLACSPTGKQYESILVLNSRPHFLVAGLTVLGQKKGSGGKFQGDKTRPKGSKIVLTVSWTDPKSKKPKRYRAEDLVWNYRTRQPMKRVGWVFTGSRFVKNPNTGKEVFMANVTGTMIVTYHDPDSILDTPHKSGADDTSFYANHLLLPPRGTPIIVRVYPKAVYDALPKKEQAMDLPKFNEQTPKDQKKNRDDEKKGK